MAARLANVRQAFNRLSQQEQLMVLFGAGVLIILILLGLAWGFSSAITRAEHRVKVKTEQSHFGILA